MLATEATPRLISDLLEALLISFEYSRPERRFTLVVTDYPRLSQGSEREFAMVTCSEVEEFTRYIGIQKRLEQFVDRYSLRNEVGSFVVQAATMAGTTNDWQLHLGFGHSLGAVHFHCGRVAFHRRGSVGRRNEAGVVEYYSLEGLPFDFYAPFDQEPSKP